jgi:hypothetical protein
MFTHIPQPDGPWLFNSLPMQLVGAAQALLEQLRDLQSRLVVQPEVLAHWRQEASSLLVQLCAHLPPQSVPVSVPFLVESLH